MRIAFPDESKMERSADGTEPIRGGSVGLNRILGFFVEAAKVDKTPRWPLVVINGATVFRNVFSPDKSFPELVKDWEHDISLFLEYLTAYLSEVYLGEEPEHPVSVIVYLPTYQRVQPSLRRVHTGHQLKQDDLFKKFLTQYGGAPDRIVTTPYIDHWIVSVGQESYPHVDLSRWLDRYIRIVKTQWQPSSPLVMISHNPIDFHLYVRRPKMCLLESYTGRIVTPKDFRFKLDKRGTLPFITLTHIVFGDKLMIAPMIKPKIRQRLIDQSADQRWLTRSPDFIRKQITEVTNLPGSILRSVSFA